MLAELIGRPWPIDGAVEVRQAVTPYLYGYAGWFSAVDKQIEIGEDLDQEVALHELSHAWFSENWFAERWLSEGYAQTYSNLGKARLGGTEASPKPIDTSDPGHVLLNEWGDPKFTDGADDVETYGYNAAWSVVSQITTDLGQDTTRRVFEAIDGGTIAYVGDAPAESIGSETDWRRYLDLVDELGGSTVADDMIEKYVATPAQLSDLKARREAREKYDALETAGGDWAPPRAVREAMASWSFGKAETLISSADRVIGRRDELAKAAAELGVTTPTAEAAYEDAGKDLSAPLKTIDDQLDATKKLSAAIAAEARGDGVFGGVGLIGARLRGELGEARTALAAGKTGRVRAIAAHVNDVIANAPDLGKQRAALVGGGFVLFVLLIVGSAVLIRRRRRKRADALRSADLAGFDEDALTGASESGVDDGLLVAPLDVCQASGAAGIVEHEVVLGHVGDPVLQLHEDVGTMVEAQAVARTQVLIDPYPHDDVDTTAAPAPVGESTPAGTVGHMGAPVAKQVPHQWQRPTGTFEDPWSWLRNRDDPDTIAYLEAENAFANNWFAGRADLIETIFEEIKSRVQETDTTAPVKDGDWWYLSRTEEGRNYPVHCRGRSAATAAEQVLLDENLEAEGHEFFSVDAFDVSPDHRLLAWSADLNGGEHYTLRIRDLDTGADTADVVEEIAWCGTAWSKDNRSVFYVTANEAMRPYRVWRHDLGTVQAADTLVFEEPDERCYVYVGLSRSGEWIVIDSHSKTSSEVRLIPADAPTSPPLTVRPRTADVEYSVDHWGDRFVIVTNLDAEDFRVMTAPLDQPGVWTEFVAHQSGRRIVAAEPFHDHLVLHEWCDAQQRLRVIFSDGGERIFDLGPEPHDVEVDANPEWRADTFRFRYQSLTTPMTVFEETVRDGQRTALKQTPVPNADLSRYTATREWATSADGTKVPVDLVRHVDTPQDGTAPCLLYGYGSYELAEPPWFSAARLSLLDRGFVWALVHPRGGGELGRRWYLDGKLLNKRNTFVDMIAASEHVVANRWAAADRLVIRGGSAGGLLVGACMTMRPELFAGVVAEVPFVDVVTTMHDTTLPLTITEWDEWGNPAEEPFASYMLSYSPYDNTTARDYPATYITAGLNDVRVSYHEPAKWTAKLRAVRTNDAQLLMRCEMGAGHTGPSGRYDLWRDEARTLAFVITIA